MSGYAYPLTLIRWQKIGHLNANLWSPEFVDCVLKTGGSSKALMQTKSSATFLDSALMRPVFLPSNECGWLGQYLSISVNAESI